MGLIEIPGGFYRSFQGSKRSLGVLGGPLGTSETRLSSVGGDLESMNDLGQFQV